MKTRILFITGCLALAAQLAAQVCVPDLCQYRIQSDRPAFHVVRWVTPDAVETHDFRLEFVMPPDVFQFHFGGLTSSQTNASISLAFHSRAQDLRVRIEDFSARQAPFTMALADPSGEALHSVSDIATGQTVTLPIAADGVYILRLLGADSYPGRVGVEITAVDSPLYSTTAIAGTNDMSNAGAYFALFGDLPPFTIEASQVQDVTVRRKDLAGAQTLYYPNPGPAPSVLGAAIREPVSPGPSNRSPALRISPDGERLAVDDNLYAVTPNALIGIEPIDQAALLGANGATVQLVGDQSLITAVRVQSPTQSQDWPLPESRLVVHYETDIAGRYVLLVSRQDPGARGDHQIELLDTDSGELILIDRYRSTVADMRLSALSPDGGEVVYLQKPRSAEPRLVRFKVADLSQSSLRIVFPTLTQGGRTVPRALDLADSGVLVFSTIESRPPDAHRMIVVFDAVPSSWHIIDRFGTGAFGLSYDVKISADGERLLYFRAGTTTAVETPHAVRLTREVVLHRRIGETTSLIFRNVARDFFLRDPNPYEDVLRFDMTADGKRAALLIRDEREPEGLTPGTIRYRADVFEIP